MTANSLEKSIPAGNEFSIEAVTLPKDKYLYQYVVAFSATLMILSSSVAFGWTSPTLPILLGENSPIPITPDESSWIVVLLLVGAFISPIPTAYLMDKFGRKVAFLLSAIPVIIAWILIGFANSIGMLYIARLLSGITFGMSYSIAPAYLGEIASDKIRGSITTLLTVMTKTGVLYVFAIGPYFSMYTMAWICLAPPLLFLTTFIWVPESPYYLVGKNRNDDAFNALARLRGHDDVAIELKKIEVIVRKSEENKSSYRELLNPDVRRSMIISLGLIGIQQFCGSQAIIAYAQLIFDKVNSGLAGSEASILLAVVQLASAVLATSIVDKVNRRPLLLFSVSGAAVSNTIVGLYFFLERMQVDTTNIGWLALLSIMTFIISYTLGVASVTFAVLSEIWPKNLRAKGSAVISIFSNLCAFTVGKMFQVVSDGMGSDVTFWIFALFSYAFIPFVWFLIPETRGKSLDIILELLKSKKHKI